mgnify:CR=1 FL=1
MFRRRRMRQFRDAFDLSTVPQILDVGGTPLFWCQEPFKVDVSLMNIDSSHDGQAKAHGMRLLIGDGCELPFKNRQFDIIFSNSTIEHVGSWERQLQFAAEARRVGRGIWVQTPAAEFFVEPHLLTPWVHHRSLAWQKRWLKRISVRSWLDRWQQSDVDAHLAEVRLISESEMRVLFPDCAIIKERFLGLTKSYIAFRPIS